MYVQPFIQQCIFPRLSRLALAGGLIFLATTNAPSQVYDFTTMGGTLGVSGSGDGTNAGAHFTNPSGIAVDATGNVFVADYGNQIIRKLVRSGTNWIVRTIAGQAGATGFADGTNGAARFNSPKAIAVDLVGNLYVTDYSNHTVRAIAPMGTNWVVTTLAGSAGNPGSNNGTNSVARFNNPKGIAVDPDGQLIVADFGNNTIRKLTPLGTNWVVTTPAGTAGMFGSANGTNGTARFNFPYGVALDSSGNIYIADYGNDIIRKLTLNGTNCVVTTIAGLAQFDGSADGTNEHARFTLPSGLAADAGNNLYVTDTFNYTIRKLTPQGTNWVVTTLAGQAGTNGAADGFGTVARFNNPSGVAVDDAGYLYVGDTLNQAIRFGQPPPALQISLVSTQAVTAWPGVGFDFGLETSSSLGVGASWSPLTNGVMVSGNNLVRTNLVNGAAFFRLRKL